MTTLVYAQPNSSFQQIGGFCPEGWVVMQSERPGINHIANESGEWIIPDPVEVALTLKDYDNALMNMFDVTAQSMNYQSWQTCAMRAYKPGPFEVECTAFFDWMESCNALGYQVLADVNSGVREQPTIEEFIAELPTFTRPVKE